MISEEVPKDDISRPTNYEADLTKLTRISEIRKGANFTKMVNQLADQQWRSTSVMPRIIETEEIAAPLKTSTEVKHDKPALLQMSTDEPLPPPRRTTPLKPLSRQGASARSSLGTVSREIRNIPSRNASLVSSIFEIQNASNKNQQKINNILNDNNNLSNILYNSRALRPDADRHTNRDPKSSVDLEELYFNTWGSRDLGLDSKLNPEKRPRVIVPKRSVPSSRIGTNNRDRHLKTETDFRSSRNGLVRIVKPFKPLPPIAHTQHPDNEENYDPDQFKREKTYVTLKRIDEILNPQKAFVNSELNSSELGILGSGSTTPVSLKKNKRETKNQRRHSYEKVLNSNNKYHQSSFINHLGGVTVIHTYRTGHNLPQTTNHALTKTSSVVGKSVQNQFRSLSPVLKCLDTEKVTSYEKCLKWIDKCSEWYD